MSNVGATKPLVSMLQIQAEMAVESRRDERLRRRTYGRLAEAALESSAEVAKNGLAGKQLAAAAAMVPSAVGAAGGLADVAEWATGREAGSQELGQLGSVLDKAQPIIEMLEISAMASHEDAGELRAAAGQLRAEVSESREAERRDQEILRSVRGLLNQLPA